MSSHKSSSNEKQTEEHQPAYITMISGSLAGICGTYVKQPIQRVKWLRQVSEHQTTMESRSMFGVFKAIIQKEGFFYGLWRGSLTHLIFVVVFFFFVTKKKNILRCTKRVTHLDQKKKKKNLSDMQQHATLTRSVSGSLASVTTTLLTHPLDTVNVRIVTQYRFFHYNRVVQTLRDIATQENVWALYQGLPLTLFGTMLRGGLGFGIYETTKSYHLKNWQDRSFASNFAQRLILGFAAGTITTTICYPIDTIRR
ncbi:hypothetical protein RFI_06249 [Reticulomyxa filosa]|uniref:Mitochondrial carrier protein n=1 Tax=Reticulomyxa filosa TaxID=46433 RepID=X6NY44_RETFI|nr:hypothetical protein RFI_06249 [Reticulomyxa filosa]|eukprot:ETO30871.1 hypothetical protein RFI_06249 [Reticulomyxa filosa]